MCPFLGNIQVASNLCKVMSHPGGRNRPPYRAKLVQRHSDGLRMRRWNPWQNEWKWWRSFSCHIFLFRKCGFFCFWTLGRNWGSTICIHIFLECKAKGFRFTFWGSGGEDVFAWPCFWCPQPIATVCNRPRATVVRVKLPCLWETLPKHVFLDVSEDVVMSFCVAGMAPCDIRCVSAGMCVRDHSETKVAVSMGKRGALHSTVHSTLNSHFTLHTLHSHSTLSTPHFTLHTPHFTLHTPHLHLILLALTSVPLHDLHSGSLVSLAFSTNN